MKPFADRLGCALVLLCASAMAFPADKGENATETAEEANAAFVNSSTPSRPSSTAKSTLHPEDRKQFLSYVLGHPKKQASLKTPSHLMNPDKYEFYTFDDDGQIVKKLMSVQEIQRIIANNDRGQPNEHNNNNPNEFYQIITVSPDIEPPPAVSRINPSEPYFSVHDVIASVQNVLKSEINSKRGGGAGTSPRPNADEDAAVTTTPTTTTTRPATSNETSSASTETTENAKSEENASEQVEITTYRPKLNITEVAELVQADKENKVGAASNLMEESVPLLLTDAHPGLISNETFVETRAPTVEELPRVPQLSHLQDAKPGDVRDATESAAATTETTEATKASPAADNPMPSEVQIPMNQDLAESVSSVLSQIASGISLGQLDGSLLPTETAETRTNVEDEDNTNKKAESVDVNDIYITTELPETTVEPEVTTEATAEGNDDKTEEQLAESASSGLQNALSSHNNSKLSEKLEEEATTTAAAAAAEEPTTTAAYEETTTQGGGEVVHSREETGTQDPEIEAKEDIILLGLADGERATTSVETLISVQPETAETSGAEVETGTTTEAAVRDSGAAVEVIRTTIDGESGKIQKATESPDEVTEAADESTTIVDEREKDVAEGRITESYSETTTAAAATTEEGTEAATEVAETATLDDSVAYERANLTETDKNATDSGAPAKLELEPEATTTEAPEARTDGADINDGAESKILPERQVDAATRAPTPTTTTTTTTRTTTTTVAATTASDNNQPALKQNVAYKPFFNNKPQKPVYIKPTKVKTPAAAAKPTKVTGDKPAGTGSWDSTKDAETKKPFENHFHSSPATLELDAAPAENLGLEATTVNLNKDVKQFADLCNELAFSLWSSVTHSGLSFVRSVVVSPFAVTSLLAMVFLGARGPTSGQMNDVLKLDEMVTFNPHLVFRNVTESLVISRNPGVATAAFVRELYSDKSKGKLLDFYKERVQQFYDGHVEEINFKAVGETLRRQTNHLVKRQTWGKIADFLRGSNLQLRPPLAAFSANIFQTDCSKGSSKDRDGEMYFVVLPASRLRRLVPVPAVVWRDHFLAGYEPNLDATAVAISPSDSVVSTIFVMPGQQGLIAPGDTLARLEHHLLGSSFRRGHWPRLMKSLLPRPGLEVQIPRLSHRSVINVTTSLQRMGLRDLFSAEKADLTGLNGLANDLHLSDMLQVNMFSTCGEDGVGARHISEVYPATPVVRREKSSDNIFSESIENLFAVSDFEDPAISALPLELRPRQARIPPSKPGARVPEPPRLRFDRPFLYFARHNPTGLVLHVGRFNPRLTT